MSPKITIEDRIIICVNFTPPKNVNLDHCVYERNLKEKISSEFYKKLSAKKLQRSPKTKRTFIKVSIEAENTLKWALIIRSKYVRIFKSKNQ